MIVLATAGERAQVDFVQASLLVLNWLRQLKGRDEEHIKFDLNGKSYNHDAAQAIASFLVSDGVRNRVKIANLSDIIAGRLKEEGFPVLKTICDALEGNSLEEVDLSDNAMGLRGLENCRAVLRGHPLKSLKLCNNGLSAEAMEILASDLTEGGHACVAKHLKTIRVHNNMCGPEGCGPFSNIISQANDLEDVDFSETRGQEGSPLISSALCGLATEGKLTNLVRLHLDGNTFSNCYVDLANAFPSCTKLEDLDLNDCSLGDKGTIAICEALIQAKAPLKFLSLVSNGIGEESSEGARSIGRLVGSINSTIESFDVSENEDLKCEGICIISGAIDSVTLREIRFNQTEAITL